MDVKVLCQCGAKFQFEIEPVNGRMPCPIKCPSCGADATEPANAVIAEKLAAMPPAPAPVPVAVTAPAATIHVAPPPAGQAARVSVSASAHAPAASAPAQEGGVAHCPKHREEMAVAECFVCQKPICTKCMEQFGFLCSAYCKGQADARKLQVPVYAGQSSQRVRKEGRSQNLILVGTAAIAALLLGAYIWYWFIGSRPKTVFKIETGPGSPFLAADWVGEDRFFGVTPTKVTMYKVEDGSELWNADIPTGEIKGIKDRRDEWQFSFDPVVKVVGKDVWVGLPHRLLRIDGQTGKKKQEIPLAETAGSYVAGEGAFLAISGNERDDSKVMTRIDLNSGQLASDVTPSSSGARRVAGITRAMPGLQNTSLKNLDSKDEDFGEFHTTEYRLDPDYIFTGVNVAHLTRRLVEERIEVRSSTKPSGPSIIDNPGMRASQGMAAAQQFINQGQPDTKIDQSLYAVTIRRFFGGGAEWTGQVTGRPYLFPQKTVDCLVAGTTLIVFNKNNQKLWEAKLTYGISPAYYDEDGGEGPALELGNRLFFFDQGVLHCFDLKKGEAQWRVNSVGISKVAPDNLGNLYISSTTAEPEQIRYDKQVNFANMVYPAILKVDLKSGKVLWQNARVGSDATVSKGIVYTTYAQISGAEMVAASSVGESAAVHWRIFRIDPANGKDLWEHHRVGVPRDVLPKEKRVLLRYPDHLRMLKYL